MASGSTVGRALALMALATGCLSDVKPRSDEGGAVAAPEVDGEPRADHRRPSWLWSTPDGATGFRYRIDEGDWSPLDVDTTWVTAPSELDDGEHVFEVQARDAEGLYGPAAAFATTVLPVVREGDEIWRQDRTMATSQLGHPCAISSGRAYADDGVTAEDNLTATLAAVHEAQDAGADLIQIDVVDVAGRAVLDGDDDGASERASLADVLADPALRGGDQVLVLQLEETEPDELFVEEVLDALSEHRTDFARAGRHVLLRARPGLGANLDIVRQLLDTRDHLLLRPYVRTGLIFDRDEATRALVLEAADAGDDLVELEYRTPELMSLRALARVRGVGVAVHAVPDEAGGVFVAALRDTVDAVTVEAPVATARALVERPTALFYVDPTVAEDAAAQSLPYRGDGGASRSLLVNDDAQPLLNLGEGDDPTPDVRLVFDPAETRAGRLHDADTLPGGGVLVVMSVRFAQSELPDDTIMTIAGKSDHSGWALDLSNEAGAEPTLMRFSVHVAGSYHYTTVPTAGLSTTRAHLIIAAYDGDGDVALWIDNDATGVTEAVASGGMTTNDFPVVLGADPDTQFRYFFDGEINLASGQTWAPL